VLSIIAYLWSASAKRWWNTRSHTPLSAQWLNRRCNWWHAQQGMAYWFEPCPLSETEVCLRTFVRRFWLNDALVRRWARQIAGQPVWDQAESRQEDRHAVACARMTPKFRRNRISHGDMLASTSARSFRKAGRHSALWQNTVDLFPMREAVHEFLFNDLCPSTLRKWSLTA
jgi:hypothetical protein